MTPSALIRGWAIVFALSGCASGTVHRERVFDQKTMPDVDALTLQLLAPRVRDCGVHGAPANMVIAAAEWPALDCIAGALRDRLPFVARYIGNTMDSGTSSRSPGPIPGRAPGGIRRRLAVRQVLGVSVVIRSLAPTSRA